MTFYCSCSEDNDITTPRNLQEYIETFSSEDAGNVIACAASADGNTKLTYVFYYPEEGATDIRYYEANSVNVDENDLSNYRKYIASPEDVFGGKLQRFSRSSENESWSIITYVLEGKLHISNPIRLKNATNATIWQETVTIDNSESLHPIFTWSNFGRTDNDIYFQVISDKDDVFISGTYTNDAYFKYYDTSNVVLNINTETPSDLVLEDTYNFTLMAVSEDNWVNLVIQKSFVAQ
ncbi:hypothetical protein [Polaribacter sp. R77954]|uniref:hypothetical protein n=1 Tax=Polaribacter sp. R77954 TaxID=3093870 RepID=UPI0037C9856E